MAETGVLTGWQQGDAGWQRHPVNGQLSVPVSYSHCRPGAAVATPAEQSFNAQGQRGPQGVRAGPIC